MAFKSAQAPPSLSLSLTERKAAVHLSEPLVPRTESVGWAGLGCLLYSLFVSIRLHHSIKLLDVHTVASPHSVVSLFLNGIQGLDRAKGLVATTEITSRSLPLSDHLSFPFFHMYVCVIVGMCLSCADVYTSEEGREDRTKERKGPS